MLAENKKIFDYIGLTAYHEAGYTGKGVPVAHLETDSYMPGKHSYKVRQCLDVSAPDAEVIPIGVNYASEEEKEALFQRVYDSGCVLATMSLAGEHFSEVNSAKLTERMTLFKSAGNNDYSGVQGCGEFDSWLTVGAVNLNKSGVPVIAPYSARDEKLDTVSFVPYIMDRYVVLLDGTSFASPFLTGMLACYFQYHFETYGRYPTQPEVVQLLKTSTKDLGPVGFDTSYGNGVFIMPLIGIDTGHGGTDPGAIGPAGTLEKDINLAISKELCNKLIAAGLECFMTRKADETMELITRAALIDNMKCDLSVSIHCNANPDPNPNYIATYIQGLGEEAEKLAEIVQPKLVAATGWEDGGVKVDNLYMNRETNCPSILVECGFISNPEQEIELNKPEVQSKIAGAIAQGFIQYLGIEVKEDAPVAEDWKEAIMNRAREAGLIDKDAEHNADDPAPKWFVLDVILDAMKVLEFRIGGRFTYLK